MKDYELKLLLLLSLSFAACISLASSVHAAAIYVKNSDEPVLGFIKSRTATHINIVVSENGESRERLIPVEDIVELLETVVPQRLSSLDPARLSEYRDYAEELMVKRADPEARDMAIRLFVIAAYLGDGDLRSSSLRGLVSLSRTSEERRQFLALAWRYGAIALTGEKDSTRPVVGGVSLSEEQQSQLTGPIRSARAGVARRAKTQASTEEVKTLFAENDLGMTHAEFVGLVSKTNLDAADLKSLVELELRILNELRTTDAVKPASQPWSQSAVTAGNQPVASLDLQSITEFNPEACYFVDGRWSKSR